LLFRLPFNGRLASATLLAVGNRTDSKVLSPHGRFSFRMEYA